MKYLISESKIDSIIRKYLDDNYKSEYDQWGEFYFEINDHVRYKYVDGKLTVGESPDLDNYFGNLWRDVFATWFEEHTGLRVYEYKVID